MKRDDQVPLGRQEFYARIYPHHLTPLWEVLHALVPPVPNTPCVPAFWKYDALQIGRAHV